MLNAEHVTIRFGGITAANDHLIILQCAQQLRQDQDEDHTCDRSAD